MSRDELAQRAIQVLLADLLAQAIEDERAFLVVNVRLILHAHQRQLLDQLAAAAAQVAIELVLQELAHLLAARIPSP